MLSQLEQIKSHRPCTTNERLAIFFHMLDDKQFSRSIKAKNDIIYQIRKILKGCDLEEDIIEKLEKQLKETEKKINEKD